MEPQRDAGGLLFPERRCHFRGVSCALCGHKRQFSVSFTRRRPKRNKNFLTGPHGAPSSPASGKTAHLMAACCMHAPPLLYALLPLPSLYAFSVISLLRSRLFPQVPNCTPDWLHEIPTQMFNSPLKMDAKTELCFSKLLPLVKPALPHLRKRRQASASM